VPGSKSTVSVASGPSSVSENVPSGASGVPLVNVCVVLSRFVTVIVPAAASAGLGLNWNVWIVMSASAGAASSVGVSVGVSAASSSSSSPPHAPSASVATRAATSGVLRSGREPG